MKAMRFLLVGAVALFFGGFLPEAEADVIKRAMYINSGGKQVYEYVYQADRGFCRSYSRSRDYRRDYGYGYPYYFGSSYSYGSPVYRHHGYRGHHLRHFGNHYGYHHGVHGAFSTGGLQVHFNF